MTGHLKTALNGDQTEIILAAIPNETLALAPPLADGRKKLMWALHRGRTSFNLETRHAGRIVKGLMKGVTTSEVDENEAEELEARDLEIGIEDVCESNTNSAREPPFALVGDGTDVDESQVATDVSTSEKANALCLIAILLLTVCWRWEPAMQLP